MIIMVDGIDKSGKTTFIKTMVNEFLSKKRRFNGILVWKNNFKPSSNSEKERNEVRNIYLKASKLFCSNAFKNILVVTDRNFMSEMVYSIKRGYDAMNDPELLKVEKFYEKNNAIYVWVNTGKKFFERKMSDQGDDYIKKLDYGVINKRYKLFFDTTNLKKVQVRSLNFKVHSKKLVKMAEEMVK